MFSFNANYLIKNSTLTKVVRPITEIGRIQLYKYLEAVDGNAITLNCCTNVQSSFAKFIDTIQHYLYLFFPLKTTKSSGKTPIYWFNDELRQMREKLFFCMNYSY